MRLLPRRSAWVMNNCPRPAARLRLFCLPFAGGGASAYREWPSDLPDDVEVCLIQLPGRENRFDEPAIDRVEWLVGQLMDGLTPYLDRPFAFFGHSMGALIAFELARRLDVIGLEPVHFFASGYHAPHLPGRSPVRHHLPDREFITAIRNLDGVPIEVQHDGELLEMMLPTLRSDFRLAETYAYVPRPPLRCAVTAFGGLEDKEVTPDEIKAWSLHTTGPFEMHVLPGGHFFLRSCRASLLRLVSSNLRASAKVTWAGDVKMGSREARRFRG